MGATGFDWIPSELCKHVVLDWKHLNNSIKTIIANDLNIAENVFTNATTGTLVKEVVAA